MNKMDRLYFDNAATSCPKPPGVLDAMVDYAQRLGGSPGRGAYNESREAGELMWRCRERIARVIGATSPKQIVFALNCSDALNLAIKGLLLPHLRARRPTVAVTTWLDHNSVLRPLNALVDRHPESFRRVLVRPDPETGILDPADIRAAIRRNPGTRLVAINHVSNVTGVIQPIAEIGRMCREEGVPLLVDGAQSLGHIPIDVESMHIDLLAFPGHKGLLGPTGTGGLYLRPGMEELVETLREGGTGSRSEIDTQPLDLPDKYEPGSQNAIGIIGLSEGVRYLLEYSAPNSDARGVAGVAAHERELIDAFFEGIRGSGETGLLPGLNLMGTRLPRGRIGVFTLTIDGVSPHELAAILESQFGILTRAGIHCAPLAHRLHTETAPMEHPGGTRFSLGPFLTGGDIHRATSALAEICEEFATVRARL